MDLGLSAVTSIAYHGQSTHKKQHCQSFMYAIYAFPSFSPGFMDNIGLGYSAMSDINPRVILTSITPFGQEGPCKEYRASDIVAMATGGLMFISGDSDRSPVRCPFSTLCFSATTAWISFLLYLVRSLNSQIPLGGMKLPLSKPLRKSLHNHSLSSTSVFLPGTCFTCRALTKMTSK